jgi:hypothetical protein
MKHHVVGSAIAALVLAISATGAIAATKATKPAAKHQPATTKTEAAEATSPVSQTQLDIAQRVLTGEAQCEMNQHVSLQPIDGKPGYFKLGFKNASYVMTPEETTTGAVRLEDKKAGVVWVQIPAKSMLLNSKAGQRMVDGCTQSAQRVASN